MRESRDTFFSDGVKIVVEASYLAGYGDEKALQVARDLDAKVIRLLTEATAAAA
jgi:hypothetical protein